jgi:hypothetical protein
MKTSVPVLFESTDAKIRGLFDKTLGTGPFPTVILCHGFRARSDDLTDSLENSLRNSLTPQKAIGISNLQDHQMTRGSIIAYTIALRNCSA